MADDSRSGCMLDDPHKSNVLFVRPPAMPCSHPYAGNHPSHQPVRLRRADPLVPCAFTAFAHAHTHADLHEPTSDCHDKILLPLHSRVVPRVKIRVSTGSATYRSDQPHIARRDQPRIAGGINHRSHIARRDQPRHRS